MATNIPRANTGVGSLHVELLGSSVRFIHGERYLTRVIEAGTGEPLILIHGVGNSAESFARNLRRLGNYFHVYAVDALYHGYSSKEPYDAEHRVLRQAEAILDFMDAEGLERAHIEGESMDAGIAFELGMRFPDRCGKLILNSGSYYVRFEPTFAGGSANDLMQLCRASVQDVSPEAQRARLEYFVTHPDRITDELVDMYVKLYSDREVHASMMRVFGMTAPRGNLTGWSEAEARALQPPALVLWTDRNVGQSPEVGKHLASLLPGAQYHLIADG